MSLLALMYHRARAGRHGNAPAMLDAHFAHIAAHFHCVLPGEELADDRLNVCLTFDDAYFDFYALVYPLLRQHGLRALLAVPLNVVGESSDLPAAARLRAESGDHYSQLQSGGFCTWAELGELARSGHVAIAAHGNTHRRLDRPDLDLNAEIAVPGAILAERLERRIDSFVFPYGRFSPRSLQLVNSHYRHAFRIGGAMNFGWSATVNYRVDADCLTAPAAIFSRRRQLGYRARYLWNRLRGR